MSCPKETINKLQQAANELVPNEVIDQSLLKEAIEGRWYCNEKYTRQKDLYQIHQARMHILKAMRLLNEID